MPVLVSELYFTPLLWCMMYVNTYFVLLTGDSFLSLSSDIEEAYREYLANYNNVTVVENSYKQKEALWNDIVRVIKTSA